MPEGKEALLKSLYDFEKEEMDLVAIYQSLADVGVAQCLPEEKRAEYREYLEKLFTESKKHLAVMADLIHKYSD